MIGVGNLAYRQAGQESGIGKLGSPDKLLPDKLINQFQFPLNISCKTIQWILFYLLWYSYGSVSL